MNQNKAWTDALTVEPDLLAALNLITPGPALEIGCSAGGKNSLALHARGFQVTCYEPVAQCVTALQKTIVAQALTDINCLQRPTDYRFKGSYQFICSIMTVTNSPTLTVPHVIADMQAATQREGFNLIIAPLNASDSDWSARGGFAFQSGEISDYYRKWHILRYNQHAISTSLPGIDSQPVSRRFALILAQKVRIKQL